MASTSISYKRQLCGFVRVESKESRCDYPLYDISSVSSGIEIDGGDPVMETGEYSLSILLPEEYALPEASVSVNGDDLGRFCMQPGASELVGERYYSRYSAFSGRSWDSGAGCEGRPFLLTYGFVRIEVSAASSIDENKGDTVLSTMDIPCSSGDGLQDETISEMLNELLDGEDGAAVRWMFAGGESDGSPYSILDASLQKGASKSLSSILQLLEDAVLEYERNYNYFRSHGYSKIKKMKRRLPPERVRRSTSRELLWIAKNPNALFETPNETGINCFGRFYAPRDVETEVGVKSYDSYENRLVLGFLDELLHRSESALFRLSNNLESIRAIEERLALLKGEGRSLPALVLVSQCAARETYCVAKLKEAVDAVRKTKRRYEAIFPGVEPLFSIPLRRTKVFQEIREYSCMYDLFARWLEFGDFSLAREGFALNCLRLDKLYEYYVLLSILKWLEQAGFEENNEVKPPIQCVEYSLKHKKYSSEKKVFTLFCLRNGRTKIRLYYQPVIYGDKREENGISLHRLSRRSENKDSYWIPDFLLKVESGDGIVRWHVFDAKYSKADCLHRGYPREGTLATAISKYKMDIGGADESDRVASLWLFSGRRCFSDSVWIAERSSWAEGSYLLPRSGVGVLNPGRSCLSSVLGPILGLTENSLASFCDASRKGEPSFLESETHRSASSVRAYSGGSLGKAAKSGSPVRRMKLIEELCDSIRDVELLYESSWAERNLGFSHPLLRKVEPKGREGKLYRKMEVRGAVCYVYDRWLLSHENKLRIYVEKSRDIKKNTSVR